MNKVIKKLVKKLPGFTECRRFWRAAVKYRQPLAYLYFRFWLRPEVLIPRAPIAVANSDYSVHLLCGHRDINLLLWALSSWLKVMPDSGQIYVHDDGSFRVSDHRCLHRISPGIKVIDYAWAASQAPQWLAEYPRTLRFRQADKKYIFAIKLIDPYFVSNASNLLILDTDVLWFKTPAEIWDILSRGSSVFMQGKLTMDYHFADDQLLPEHLLHLNSGVVGFKRKNFCLATLEEFSKKNGFNNPSRVIEQAGFAYVLDAGGKIEALPRELYPLKGAVTPATVAKHYTGLRRELFWLEGVREITRI